MSHSTHKLGYLLPDKNLRILGSKHDALRPQLPVSVPQILKGSKATPSNMENKLFLSCQKEHNNEPKNGAKLDERGKSLNQENKSVLSNQRSKSGGTESHLQTENLRRGATPTGGMMTQITHSKSNKRLGKKGVRDAKNESGDNTAGFGIANQVRKDKNQQNGISESIHCLNEIFQNVPHGGINVNSLGVARGIILNKRVNSSSKLNQQKSNNRRSAYQSASQRMNQQNQKPEWQKSTQRVKSGVKQ